MKILKQIIMLVAALAATPFIQSCDTDDDNVSYFTELGTVGQKDDSSWIVKGDIYGNSIITNSNVLKQTKTDSIGQRILYYFLEEKSNETTDKSYNRIALFDIYKVLTKNADIVDNSEDIKSFGTDPIMITGSYLSEKHLNIRFQVVGSNSNIKHRISLVGTIASVPDKDGAITLELCHNANNDTFASYKWGYVSFPLESIPGYNEGNLKSIIVKYKVSENDVRTETIKLKDNKSTTMSLSHNSDEATKPIDIN